MTNEPQRQVRLRLVRRRPAPGRVRARMRDETPGPEPGPQPQPEPELDSQPEPEAARASRIWQRLRSARWSHIITVVGTAIAAVAAIGGLWAQAVTTYWSQQTAKDQLEQSKEEAAQTRSSQASRITFWLAPTKDGLRPHIANRSPDVVTSVYLVRTYNMGRVAIYLGSLAPCSETVFMPKKGGFVRAISDTTVWTRGGKPAALFFVDRVGISWRRDPTDLNQLPTPGPPQRYELIVGPDSWTETKTATLCSDA
ncbi:hypothetical protein AB0D83_37085 [Streptomyces decoyicus]|uniref:hypothetical protein n=1 Tax=Streptomyces decoyicus TaxID=249567 RepID=UPI003401CDC6